MHARIWNGSFEPMARGDRLWMYRFASLLGSESSSLFLSPSPPRLKCSVVSLVIAD